MFAAARKNFLRIIQVGDRIGGRDLVSQINLAAAGTRENIQAFQNNAAVVFGKCQRNKESAVVFRPPPGSGRPKPALVRF